MIVLGAVLAVLVLAGCGATATSGPTTRTTPTTATPLTNAQYAARLQALSDKADAITHGLPDPHSFGQPSATSALSSLAADWDSAASELAALTPPPAVESLHQDLVRDARTIASGLKRVASASQVNDKTTAYNVLGEVSGAISDLRSTVQSIQAALPSK
jgi:hypothetical protein